MRSVAALAVVGAAAALAVAYFVQDVLLVFPCPLCLWERWPYRLVIALGLAALLLPRAFRRPLLGLCVIALLAGAAIAFIHTGVEFHWWQSPLPECNGILTPGAPLPMTPAKPCDQGTYLIAHLPVSMAAMNLLYALAFAATLATATLRKHRP